MKKTLSKSILRCLLSIIILLSLIQPIADVSATNIDEYTPPYSLEKYHHYEAPGKYLKKQWELERIRTAYGSPFVDVFHTIDDELYSISDKKELIKINPETGSITDKWSNLKYLGIFYHTSDLLFVLIEKSEHVHAICATGIDSKEVVWDYVFKFDKEDILYDEGYSRKWIKGNNKYIIFSEYDKMDKIVCLDAENGDILWIDTDKDDILLDFDYMGILQDNLFFYVVRESNNAKIVCFDIESQNNVWAVEETRHDNSNVAPRSLRNYSIGLLQCSDYLYYRLSDHYKKISHIVCLDPRDGSKMWGFEYVIGVDSLYPVPFTDDVVLSSGHNMIYLNKHTGKHKWNVDFTEGIEYTMLTDGLLYFVTTQGIIIFNPETGEKYHPIKEFLWPSTFEIAFINRKLLLFNDDTSSITCFNGLVEINYRIDRKSYYIGKSRVSIDSPPVIRNNRTLLPARYVLDPLGGDILWDSEEKKVTCKLLTPSELTDDLSDVTTVELWINNPVAKVNSVEVQIDPNNPAVTPTIINDRTMVPMRFLTESLGCKLEWKAEKEEINLSYLP